MLSPDRLNPHAMLVMLGSVMYAVVGGPAVIGGGFTIALILAAWRQHERRAADRSGPTSLFGTPATTAAQERLASAPPCFGLMPALAVAARGRV